MINFLIRAFHAWKQCQNCNGTGKVDGKKCPACNGAGGINTGNV